MACLHLLGVGIAELQFIDGGRLLAMRALATIEVGPSVARSTPFTQLAGMSAKATEEKKASAPTATLDASANLTGGEIFISVTPWPFLESSFFFVRPTTWPVPSLLTAG